MGYAKIILVVAICAPIVFLGSYCLIQQRSSGLEDYNLIIIVVDALRADHLGCYGYHRNTSSFVDSRAEEGVLFERALANSSFTRESIATLFTGRLPSSRGNVGWGAHPSADTENLGDLFRQAGYKTGFFSNSPMLKHTLFTRGFEQAMHLKPDRRLSGLGPNLSKQAVEFARGCGDRKFMMYLHYHDPHGPYEPPPDYYLRFADTIYPAPVSYGRLRRRCTRLIREGFGPGDPSFEDVLVRYDAETAHSDESIRLLFSGLEELGALDNTFVIITADHGEEFLEHGYVAHGWTLYTESLHIPLIFWAPKHLKPDRIGAYVSLVDLLPTVLELMDIPHERSDFDGSPLFVRDEGGVSFQAPEGPVIAELLIQARSLLRAVIQDDWKYIVAQKWLTPKQRQDMLPTQMELVREYRSGERESLDIWGPVVYEELYNLATDPLEQNSRLGEPPAKLETMRVKLNDYKTYCLRYGLGGYDESGSAEPISEDDVGQLKALGYL